MQSRHMKMENKKNVLPLILCWSYRLILVLRRSINEDRTKLCKSRAIYQSKTVFFSKMMQSFPNFLRFFLPTEGFSMVFFFRVPCERNLFWGPYLFTVSILYLLFLLTECCVGWFGSQFSSWPVKWPFTAFWHSFLHPGCCFLWLPLASVSPDHVSSTGSIQSVV